MNDFTNKIIQGNNLDILSLFSNNSIDSFITDVPYALSDIDPLKMIKDGVNNKSGFMNASWDCLPTVEMLKEFYRVLKTGGVFVTTFTPRQDLQTVFIYRLMEAGFDVSFSPLYFCYKSGFPKASNYGKVIDKHFNAEREVVGSKVGLPGYSLTDGKGGLYGGGFGANGTGEGECQITKPTTPEAIYCDGLYSLALKPAVEPILIAQKPHNKAKYKQALDWYYERKELLDKGIHEEDLSLYTKNASGGCWIENGRIPTSQDEKDDILKKAESFKSAKDTIFFNQKSNIASHRVQCADVNINQGRFPANLLCGFPVSKEELRSEYPEATEEELDKMVNMIENPLDVGRVCKSSGALRRNNQSKTTGIENGASCYGKFNDYWNYGHDDQGDISRYFSLTAWSKKHFPNLHNIAEKTLQLQEDVKKTGDCLFVCKPAQSEKNAGLEGQNKHVCVKPISLYNYLVTLFSKEGDIILDPFCGSGVTPIACVLTNRKYIGIEMSEEYHKIAEARVEYWKQQKQAVKSASASKKNVSASKSIDTNQGSLF